MTQRWPDKDPDDILDYKVDWTDSLSDEVIVTSTWLLPAEITKVSDDYADTSATIWLSGGTALDNLTITNRIFTSAGRQMDQSVLLRIRTR